MNALMELLALMSRLISKGPGFFWVHVLARVLSVWAFNSYFGGEFSRVSLKEGYIEEQLPAVRVGDAGVKLYGRLDVDDPNMSAGSLDPIRSTHQAPSGVLEALFGTSLLVTRPRAFCRFSLRQPGGPPYHAGPC